MAAVKYFLAVAALIGGAGVMNRESGEMGQDATAMIQKAIAIRQCVEDRIMYRGFVMSCDTPISFADIRKLEMRADNLAHGLGTGPHMMTVGN